MLSEKWNKVIYLEREITLTSTAHIELIQLHTHLHTHAVQYSTRKLSLSYHIEIQAIAASWKFRRLFSFISTQLGGEKSAQFSMSTLGNHKKISNSIYSHKNQAWHHAKCQGKFQMIMQGFWSRTTAYQSYFSAQFSQANQEKEKNFNRLDSVFAIHSNKLAVSGEPWFEPSRFWENVWIIIINAQQNRFVWLAY